MDELENDIYNNFMNNGEEHTLPEPSKKIDPKPLEKEGTLELPEGKTLGMWEFIHHDNENVTMGPEMFKKLMERLLP